MNSCKELSDAPYKSTTRASYKDLHAINHNWDTYNLCSLIDKDLLPKTFEPRGKAKVQDAEYWDSRVVPMLASISWICKDISRVNKLLRRAVKMRVAAGWEEDEECLDDLAGHSEGAP